MQTLLGKDDIVISDQLNHASIIDAVRVAGVKNKFACGRGAVMKLHFDERRARTEKGRF